MDIRSHENDYLLKSKDRWLSFKVFLLNKKDYVKKQNKRVYACMHHISVQIHEITMV